MLRADDAFYLAGSLDERTGFTRLCSDAKAGKVTLERECPNRALPAGRPVALMAVALIYLAIVMALTYGVRKLEQKLAKASH